MPEAIMQGAGCLPGDGGHEWAPSLAQNRWTARFKDRPTDRPTACSTEHEYQMWHGEQQIPLLRVGLLVGFVIVTVQLIFGTSDPNTMVGRLAVAYPEQAWMTKGVGACSRICVGIGGLLLFSRRVRSALVSRRLVQAYTVVVLCTCGTLDLVAVYWLASWSGEQERSSRTWKPPFRVAQIQLAGSAASGGAEERRSVRRNASVYKRREKYKMQYSYITCNQ